MPPLFLLLLLLLSSFHGALAISLYEAGTAHFSTRPNASSTFWLSANGNLTFGFKTLGPDQYLLCIWMTADAQQTPLWWPNLANPILTQEGATLSFTSNGNLQLSSESSSAIIWSTPSDVKAPLAKLQNTGNLQLLDQDAKTILWQSFLDLRDSLIIRPRGLNYSDPLSSIVRNKTNLLRSRSNDSSYAPGRFHVETDDDQNAYLHAFDSNYNLDFIYVYAHMNASNDFFELTRDGGRTYRDKSTVPRTVLRLDTDGNLRIYTWNASSSRWDSIWPFLTSKCWLGSPCGPFSLCKNESDGSPVNCTCPIGYEPVDTRSVSLGCRTTNFDLSSITCTNGSGSNGSLYMAENAQGGDYNYNDLIQNGQSISLELCKQQCLDDCNCMAVSYRSSDGTCYLKGNSKTSLLMNGRTPAGNTLFMKLLNSTASGRSTGKQGATLSKGAVVRVVVAVAMVGMLVGAGLFIMWRSKRKQSRWDKDGSGLVSDAGPIRFAYQQMVEATHNFNELLGEGGFGNVYKGTIVVVVEKGKKQQIPVAVKVLKITMDAAGHKEAEKQFKAEVSTLGKIHHVNLVALLGYCIGGRAPDQRILVYEYIPNGSLAQYLSTHEPRPLPSWGARYSIALGMARGIAYLHHDCKPHIFHCDIKPQNVLLDHDFTPKVADFGLARRFEDVKSHLTMSGLRGTRGYMAPEWLKTDEITSKADVYSYGMVLLELVRGFVRRGDDDESIVDWAYQQFISRRGGEEVGGSIRLESDEGRERMQLLKIGLWCVQNQPNARPTMSRVVKLIEGNGDEVETPPYPASTIAFAESSLSSGSSTSANSRVTDSYSALSAR